MTTAETPDAPAAEQATTELANAKKPPPLLTVGARGLIYTTYDEMWRFASMIARAGDYCPKDFRNKPEAAMVALQMGSEVGLSPLFALRNICVIHGRACLYGDAFIGVVRNCPGWAEDGYREWYEGEGDDLAAHCQVRRGTGQLQVGVFSVEDAKSANLWDPDGAMARKRDKQPGVWTTYPRDMLMWRARTRVMRRVFADALAGLTTTEEAMDIPVQTATEFVDQPSLPAPSTPLGKATAAAAKAKPDQGGGVVKADPPSAGTKSTAAAPDPIVSDEAYKAIRAAWRLLTDDQREAIAKEHRFILITDVKKFTVPDASDLKAVIDGAAK